MTAQSPADALPPDAPAGATPPDVRADGSARASLDELFRPASVAVIGASDRPGSVGASVFRNILRSGFRGVAYPVNPTHHSVSGVRCFPDVDALPETPDLAVIVVPAPAVAGVVERLGQRGTRGAVVISAGFREVGAAGAALEADLVERARAHGMSLVGPNCFGLLNTDPRVGLNATFSAGLPPAGNVAFISQSGALCAGILAYGAAERIGFSRFVSVGNRAGIDECDLLRALADDPATHVVLIYVESLANGRRFLETAQEVTEAKPVLIIKSGRTAVGERAARSHTGSIAQSGRDRLYDALFEQSGVIRADTLGELFRWAKIFAADVALDGPRLAILTNSGGPGIVAADAAVRYGLTVPPLAETTRATLGRSLPGIAALANPVDMTADIRPEQIDGALRTVLADPAVDGVLAIATPTGTMSGPEVARAILGARSASPKAVVACLFGLTDMSEEMTMLDAQGVPAFTFPEEAVQGLSVLARYHAWRTRPRTSVRRFPVDRAAVADVIAKARAEGRTVLPEYEARALLSAYGVPFAESRLCRSRDEALAAAAAIGFPVVLKVASPEISHKTDVGGVIAGIGDAEQLRAAWDRMGANLARNAPNAHVEGFEVEAFVGGGKEVLVGVQRDPEFGPIIVFGLGGIYVEVLRDVTFRLAPLRTRSAERMVETIRSFPLLTGVRGEAPSDLAALEEVIERVAQLSVEVPAVAELDLNPLIVRSSGQGVRAVDARIVLG